MSEVRVTRDNSFEAGIGYFTTEASTLGLPPGSFPERLPTTLGNGLDFVRRNPLPGTPDCPGFEYRQELGCITLIVLND